MSEVCWTCQSGTGATHKEGGLQGFPTSPLHQLYPTHPWAGPRICKGDGVLGTGAGLPWEGTRPSEIDGAGPLPVAHTWKCPRAPLGTAGAPPEGDSTQTIVSSLPLKTKPSTGPSLPPGLEPDPAPWTHRGGVGTTQEKPESTSLLARLGMASFVSRSPLHR